MGGQHATPRLDQCGHAGDGDRHEDRRRAGAWRNQVSRLGGPVGQEGTSLTGSKIFQSRQEVSSSGSALLDGRTAVRSGIGSITLAAVTVIAAVGAQAFDQSNYPDWSGQWKRPAGVGNQWDTSKPPRRGQQAPLTPEYQVIYEA